MKDEEGNRIDYFWDYMYGGVFSLKNTDGSNPPKYYGRYTDKNNKWYPFDHWYEHPKTWLISVLIIILFFISCCIYHNHKYMCIKSHKVWVEEEMIGNIIESAHYECHCDEEILRTEYEKNIEKYQGINKKCECQ